MLTCYCPGQMSQTMSRWKSQDVHGCNIAIVIWIILMYMYFHVDVQKMSWANAPNINLCHKIHQSSNRFVEKWMCIWKTFWSAYNQFFFLCGTCPSQLPMSIANAPSNNLCHEIPQSSEKWCIYVKIFLYAQSQSLWHMSWTTVPNRCHFLVTTIGPQDKYPRQISQTEVFDKPFLMRQYTHTNLWFSF